MSKSYTKELIEKLKSELKTVTEERDYLKQCCIDADMELSKYSFKWDGKEKNLVVQALQLNEMYEELKKKVEDNQ